jgi:DNA-binding CsgD family transcriptional regulator
VKRIFKWFFFLCLTSGLGMGAWWTYQNYWATPPGPSIAELHTQYLQLSDSLIDNEFAMRDSASPEAIQRAQARQQWLQARISALRSQMESHKTGMDPIESEAIPSAPVSTQTAPEALSSPSAISSGSPPMSQAALSAATPTADVQANSNPANGQASEEEMWTVIYWTVGSVVGVLALIMIVLGIQIWRKRKENQSSTPETKELDPFAAAEAKVRASGKYKLQQHSSYDDSELQLPEIRPRTAPKPSKRIESPILDEPYDQQQAPYRPSQAQPQDTEAWDWPGTHSLPEPPTPKQHAYQDSEVIDSFELVPPPLNPIPLKPLVDAIQDIDTPARAQSPADQGESLRQDILKLARRGFTSSEIARRLRISQDQVEFAIRLQREKGNHG